MYGVPGLLTRDKSKRLNEITEKKKLNIDSPKLIQNNIDELNDIMLYHDLSHHSICELIYFIQQLPAVHLAYLLDSDVFLLCKELEAFLIISNIINDN